MDSKEDKETKSWWRQYWWLPASIFIPFILVFLREAFVNWMEIATNEQKSLDYLGKQLTSEQDLQIFIDCCPAAASEALPFALAGLMIAGSTYLIIRKSKDQSPE